jgi:hypothetical protein
MLAQSVKRTGCGAGFWGLRTLWGVEGDVSGIGPGLLARDRIAGGGAPAPEQMDL